MKSWQPRISIGLVLIALSVFRAAGAADVDLKPGDTMPFAQSMRFAVAAMSRAAQFIFNCSNAMT